MIRNTGRLTCKRKIDVVAKQVDLSHSLSVKKEPEIRAPRTVTMVFNNQGRSREKTDCRNTRQEVPRQEYKLSKFPL